MKQNLTPAHTSRILIIDNDVEVGKDLTTLLEHNGHQVEVVKTGAEAFSRARQQKFDAVLLDVVLPDLDGLAVMDQLIQLDPKLPIIFLTAFTSLEKAVGPIHKCGAFAHLSKPYNGHQLISIIHQAVKCNGLAHRAERVQHALSASEERFHSVLQSTNDAVILANRKGTILSWNQAAEDMFGFTQQEILGKPLTLIMPARFREAHQRGLQRLNRDEATTVLGKTVELTGLRKCGSEFPIELSLGKWSTPSEVCFCGIIRDITHRIHIENALRHRIELESLVANISTHFLSLLPEKVDEGITHALKTIGEFSDVDRSYLFLFSDDGKKVLNSHEWCRDGISSHIQTHQEISIETFPWAMHLIQDQKIIQISRLSHLPPEAKVDRGFLNAHGIQSLLNVPMVHRDSVVGFLGFDSIRSQKQWAQEDIRLLKLMGEVLTNTLKHKRAEVALQESEIRFRQVAENIHEVLWLTNLEKTEMLYVSPGYEEIWGRTCQSLYHNPCAWIEAIHPEDRERVRKAALQRQTLGTYDETYRVIRPDGTIRWIRDRAFPIRDHTGKIYRLTGIAENISEHPKE